MKLINNLNMATVFLETPKIYNAIKSQTNK